MSKYPSAAETTQVSIENNFLWIRFAANHNIWNRKYPVYDVLFLKLHIDNNINDWVVYLKLFYL